jgi:hypothetical protein
LISAYNSWSREFESHLGDVYLIQHYVIKFVNDLRQVGDTKGVIRIRKSKKDRQHNGQKKKYKGTNNDLQNIHIKLKIEEHGPH